MANKNGKRATRERDNDEDFVDVDEIVTTTNKKQRTAATAASAKSKAPAATTKNPKSSKAPKEKEPETEVIPILYQPEDGHPFFRQLKGQYKCIPIKMIMEFDKDAGVTREKVLIYLKFILMLSLYKSFYINLKTKLTVGSRFEVLMTIDDEMSPIWVEITNKKIFSIPDSAVKVK